MVIFFSHKHWSVTILLYHQHNNTHNVLWYWYSQLAPLYFFFSELIQGAHSKKKHLRYSRYGIFFPAKFCLSNKCIMSFCFLPQIIKLYNFTNSSRQYFILLYQAKVFSKYSKSCKKNKDIQNWNYYSSIIHKTRWMNIFWMTKYFEVKAQINQQSFIWD